MDATRQLRYKGHVSPGVLMVGGPPCALEVLRAAWARNVLRPPADHAITCLGKYLLHLLPQPAITCLQLFFSFSTTPSSLRPFRTKLLLGHLRATTSLVPFVPINRQTNHAFRMLMKVESVRIGDTRRDRIGSGRESVRSSSRSVHLEQRRARQYGCNKRNCYAARGCISCR